MTSKLGRTLRRYARVLPLILTILVVYPTVPSATAFQNGQAASLVIGQPNFTTGTIATTQTGLQAPFGVAFDSAGNFWVADTYNQRILMFAPPFSNGQSASLVIGQSNFTTATPATTQTGLNYPQGIAFDSSGNLWVTDNNNNRVLKFSRPFSNDESASLVIGQSSFTTNTAATTQNGLRNPAGLAFDSLGNLWVADTVNHRVLEFSPPFSNGESASLVIGQSSFTTSTHATTQNGLFNPASVGFDSSANLWVADDSNSRVMRFASPFSNGQSASLVIGQSSFTTNTCAVTQTGLCGPLGFAFDSLGNIWVADHVNQRVLMSSPPFSNGESASLVIGQSSFTTNTAATTQNGLSGPEGVAFDSLGNIWVSDGNNNRVLEVQPQPFDYGMTNSGGISTIQGGSGSNSITTTLASGASQPVTFSCSSGLPAGASCSFKPGSGSPGFSSTLTINTTSSTPIGLYNITVTGTGGGQTHTTRFALNVCVHIGGDANGDCVVDISDLAIVGAAFGSTPSSPNWNPKADLNADGKVDISDLAIVGAHFGQHNP